MTVAQPGIAPGESNEWTIGRKDCVGPGRSVLRAHLERPERKARVFPAKSAGTQKARKTRHYKPKSTARNGCVTKSAGMKAIAIPETRRFEQTSGSGPRDAKLADRRANPSGTQGTRLRGGPYKARPKMRCSSPALQGEERRPFASTLKVNKPPHSQRGTHKRRHCDPEY